MEYNTTGEDLKNCLQYVISKEKITHLWLIGWKPKAYTSCVPYLEVFKNDLYL